MFFIVQVNGCLPHISLMIDKDGEVISFDTKSKAIRYATRNCAWDFKVIEF